MKSLRKTIRKILLENKSHYEKIATMLCTGDLDSVKQAIELAETMGYAHRVDYKSKTRTFANQLRTPQIVHRWTFSVPRDFQTLILNMWSKEISTNGWHGRWEFALFGVRSHSIGIKLVEGGGYK